MTKIEDQDIKKLLKKAVVATEGLPETLKVKAFELAFNQMICSDEKEKKTSPKTTTVVSGSGDLFTKIQEETEIPVSELKSVFKLDKNDEIKVIVPLTGTIAEKQRTLAYLYFFAKRVGFNIEWVSALEFAKQTNEYGINDSHVSKNLKQDKTNIRQSGYKRGKEYSLTPNGIIKAKKVIQSFITA